MKTKLLYSLFFVSFFQMIFSQNVSLDTSFGVDGKVSTSFGIYKSTMNSLAIQSDGKIVACGSNYNGAINQIALARYTLEGVLDASFGNNGIVLTSIGTNFQDQKNSVILLNNGKILVSSGNGNAFTGYDFAIVRYNADGTLDSSFGTNGIILTDVNLYRNLPVSIQLLEDNKFIIGGFINNLGTGNLSNFLIVKYNENGTLDTTFGSNGVVNYNFGTIENNLIITVDDLSVLKIQADGKIIVSGSIAQSDYSQYDFGLMRLNVDGSIDADFGQNGFVLTDFGSDELVESMHILDNDKIIVCGTYYLNSFSNQKIAIAQYNSDGSLDSDYGDGGKTLSDLNENQYGFVYSSEIQLDGKLLVTGLQNNNNADFFVSRFNTNGTLDTSFGVNGVQVIDSGVNEGAFTSITQPDGKIIIGGGISFTETTLDFILMRFLEPTLVTNSFGMSQNNFSVYPNPFTTSINLTFSLSKSENLTIDLIDANGRIIQNLRKEKAFSSGNNSLNLDLPETLSKGIYFLKINNGFENSTIKIIK